MAPRQRSGRISKPSKKQPSSSPAASKAPQRPQRGVRQMDSMDIDTTAAQEPQQQQETEHRQQAGPSQLHTQPAEQQYPGPLNHNGKPFHLINTQTYCPSKVNYVGGNLNVHSLIRSMLPKHIPEIRDLVISVLVFSVNRKGPFKVFLQRGRSRGQPYFAVAPEVTVPIPTDERDDPDEWAAVLSRDYMTPIGSLAYQGTAASGAENVTEIDCLLLPIMFRNAKDLVRVIAYFKCVDEEATLKPIEGADGGWLTREEVMSETMSIGGGLVMKAAIERGYNMLDAAARDPTTGFDNRQPKVEAVVAELRKVAKNDDWLPTFAPIQYDSRTYNSLREWL